jgi:iron complex outermembrane receptor protein
MSLKPIARLFHLALALAAVLGLQPAAAQQAPASPTDQVQEVIITGSRIAQTGAQAAQPLSIITSADIDAGLASVGELLSQLTTSGSALNTKFNSSGNFGYPPDGAALGRLRAVDLRNLDAKRWCWSMGFAGSMSPPPRA